MSRYTRKSRCVSRTVKKIVPNMSAMLKANSNGPMAPRAILNKAVTGAVKGMSVSTVARVLSGFVSIGVMNQVGATAGKITINDIWLDSLWEVVMAPRAAMSVPKSA